MVIAGGASRSLPRSDS